MNKIYLKEAMLRLEIKKLKQYFNSSLKDTTNKNYKHHKLMVQNAETRHKIFIKENAEYFI